MSKDRYLFVLIFHYFIISVSVKGVTSDSTYCQRYHPKPDVVEFTEYGGPATLAIGYEQVWLDLICCTSGSSQSRRITWFQTQNNGTTWSEFLFVDNKNRTIDEEGQVASIMSVNSPRDAGSYKCVVDGIQEKIRLENTVKLEIRNSSSWRDPPMWLQPFEEVSYPTAQIGQNYSATCKALMGTVCALDSDCDIFWTKGTNDDIIQETTNSSVHPRQYIIDRPKSLTKESILVIENVTEGDFGRYNCHARNGNVNGNGNGNGNGNIFPRLIFLQKFKPSQLSLTLYYIVGGSLLILSIVIIIGILVTYQTRCDLDWELWRAKRHAKNINNQINGAQGIYTVALINATENQEFAEHLKRVLRTKFNFTVISKEEVDPGRDLIPLSVDAALLDEFLRLTQNSGSVLVLLTPELTEDTNNMAIIRDVIAFHKPVFIMHGIEYDSVTDDYKATDNRVLEIDENIRGALSIYSFLVWPGVNVASDKLVPFVVDHRQSLHANHWEKPATKRQERIFLKKLQLLLLTPRKG